MAKARGGLGKGLEALFVDNNTESATSQSTLPLNEIEPNREQPRKQFESSALADLADSIKQYGILQPLVVRPMPDGTYQLVAGERRWRAARMAGLSDVPVMIRQLNDAETMELALIENLQREDLNPIEEATGYRDLMDKFSLTQEQVSMKVGKSRPVITNAMRLLNLPTQVLELLEGGKLSVGHARSLLALEEEELIVRTAQEIVKKGLSVRQVEALVKKLKGDKKESRKERVTAWDNSFMTEVELSLNQCLSRKVRVSGDDQRGQIVIDFYGQDDLQHLASLLSHGGED